LLEQQTFHWLLEHLLSPNNEKIMGCEIWIPDTALFENGKPKLVVKTDSKDGCLVRYKKTPTLSEIRKIFSVVSRERKKEHGPFEKVIDAKTVENAYQKEQQER
jgi:hypothetical protein